MFSSTTLFSIKSVYDILFNYVLGVRFNYSAVQTDLLPDNYTVINYSFFQNFLYNENIYKKRKRQHES
jgi:hypothetical protein